MSQRSSPEFRLSELRHDGDISRVREWWVPVVVATCACTP
ncbi:hypothetical protein HMPREF1549_03333 [Actinomyces johnsonii F0510]|uniref:Uncharacterized protein n=1 Tax=Actinomyces johnsonii F0510 TaxID=1227262 RepID=U1R652_9ACTO|nr:hypothetical protein HMPREF1549_03333 [Actinomyces johnsonii F0510]